MAINSLSALEILAVRCCQFSDCIIVELKLTLKLLNESLSLFLHNCYLYRRVVNALEKGVRGVKGGADNRSRMTSKQLFATPP
jgi:hypothetical protein